MCNIFSENTADVCHLEVWLAKPVIVLDKSILIVLVIGVVTVADMEVTWRHPKDG